MPADQEKFVIQLMWHLNDECNLKCRHCYAVHQKSLPVDRFVFQQMVMERIRELQVHYDIIRVGLLGGEPTLDPNVSKIVKCLCNQGIQRVDISTNGTLITPELATSLRQAGVKMVQVSLEGPNEAINDYIRGKDSFVRATNGLRILQSVGIETGIMVTVSTFNLPFMADMVKFAAEREVRIVAFNRMLPIGRGSETALTCLNANQTQHMISQVHHLNECYSSLDVSSDDPLLYVPMGGKQYTSQSFGGCGAGVGNLAISHDGTVYPCRRLPIEVGNVRDISLLDIINSSKMDCFYHREQFLKGECRTCEHRQTCGGCRAAAFAFTGDHLNSDPQCWNILQEGGEK